MKIFVILGLIGLTLSIEASELKARPWCPNTDSNIFFDVYEKADFAFLGRVLSVEKVPGEPYSDPPIPGDPRYIIKINPVRIDKGKVPKIFRHTFEYTEGYLAKEGEIYFVMKPKDSSVVKLWIVEAISEELRAGSRKEFYRRALVKCLMGENPLMAVFDRYKKVSEERYERDFQMAYLKQLIDEEKFPLEKDFSYYAVCRKSKELKKADLEPLMYLLSRLTEEQWIKHGPTLMRSAVLNGCYEDIEVLLQVNSKNSKSIYTRKDIEEFLSEGKQTELAKRLSKNQLFLDLK